MVSSKAWQMAQTSDSKKALLELGLLEGDEEGFAETLGDTELADGDLDGPVDRALPTQDAKKSRYSNQSCSKATRRAVPKQKQSCSKATKRAVPKH
jgi:hypothetical protein